MKTKYEVLDDIQSECITAQQVNAFTVYQNGVLDHDWHPSLDQFKSWYQYYCIENNLISDCHIIK